MPRTLIIVPIEHSGLWSGPHESEDLSLRCASHEVSRPHVPWVLAASSTGEPTGPFMEFLRDDVRLFGNRLTRFVNGMFQSGDSYIKVQQARFLLLERIMTQLFTQCDVCLVTSASDFDGPGLPLLALPIGFTNDGPAGQTVPEGALLAGPAYGEERLLAVGTAHQEVTDFHLQRPPEPTGAAPEVAAAATGRRAAPCSPAPSSR